MIELILELKNKCNFNFEVSHSMDLKEKEIVFLTAIADENNTTSKHLAEITGLSPSRSSRIIASLHEQGYIEMKHNPDDRRIVNLSLTDKGRICVEGINEEKQVCESDLLSGLSEEEKETIAEGLKLLLSKL